MYTLSKPDVELSEESENVTGFSSTGKASSSSLPGSITGFDRSKLLVNQPLSNNTMKQLQQLMAFENIKPCFTVNVSPCWVRVIQAQKDRKHPQHLQHQDHEFGESTLSWRLQRTKYDIKDKLKPVNTYR